MGKSPFNMKNVLKKETLGQQTAAILRDRVIVGQYAQGERLVEDDLASEFEVSRATIREALRILEMDGLLVRVINKHTTVRVLTRSEIISIFEARVLLEREAAAFCVAHDCVPVDSLRGFVEEMKVAELTPNAWDLYLKADINFHMAIIKAVQNPYIEQFWDMIQSVYMMAMYTLRANFPTIFANTSHIHAVLYEGLERGDIQPWLQHLDQLQDDISRMTLEMETV